MTATSGADVVASRRRTSATDSARESPSAVTMAGASVPRNLRNSASQTGTTVAGATTRTRVAAAPPPPSTAAMTAMACAVLPMPGASPKIAARRASTNSTPSRWCGFSASARLRGTLRSAGAGGGRARTGGSPRVGSAAGAGTSPRGWSGASKRGENPAPAARAGPGAEAEAFPRCRSRLPRRHRGAPTRLERARGRPRHGRRGPAPRLQRRRPEHCLVRPTAYHVAKPWRTARGPRRRFPTRRSGSSSSHASPVACGEAMTSGGGKGAAWSTHARGSLSSIAGVK
mmetsp:Transcript_26189/g.84681  ORF Transcript_26189/g.84681 Transcript_26189/m.84681 type:complete len:286 (+) Transcript_26189:780-1637(+)